MRAIEDGRERKKTLLLVYTLTFPTYDLELQQNLDCEGAYAIKSQSTIPQTICKAQRVPAFIA